jgi:hypothetical protein
MSTFAMRAVFHFGAILILAQTREVAGFVQHDDVQFPNGHVGTPHSSGAGIKVDGPWRFTAVTDRLIRIEYDEEQRFVDEATVVFTRALPRGVWSESEGPNGFNVLKTDKVVVQYKKDMRPSRDSLTMSSADGKYKWTWGDDPAEGNLRGTARTLDNGAETLDLNCHHKVSPTMTNSEQHCAWGLVSRLGWAVVNDTASPVLKDNWVAPSPNKIQDISVFLHGLDFLGALQDFFYSSGNPALPPRYALGSMFTRWFNFDTESVTSLVEEFESRSFPLDAWIFDMNWHQFGPWGSFTWNRDSYPHLQDLLSWMQSKKLPIGANFHEHDGISTAEETYKQVCAALNRTPGENIPFDLYNKTYALAQEDISVWAISTQGQKQGIDFSWIDYQQGEVDHFQQTTIPNLNPTITLNALRSSLQKRHGHNLRSLIVARWGGLGSHRYPVGFSGDQLHSWKGLAFLPYYTSTAANVAFNYWSHDTVGADHDGATDYELSVRWVQTSAWSPVLRFHDKGAGTGSCSTTDVCARIIPWELPSAFYKAVWEAVRIRDELLPYIYTAAFNGTFTGAALTRPMYYENPEDEALYGLDHQYLFGPDMIISPISAPSGPVAKGFEQALGANTWTVYAPKARNGIGWVDRLNGDFWVSQNVTSVYGIRDVPGFELQGAVVPMRPRLPGESTMARAAQTLDAVEFRIAPAEAFYKGESISGSGVAVDDDGVTTDYLQDQVARTKLEYNFEGRTFKIKLSQTGNFPGRPDRVLVRLAFPQLPPMEVKSVSPMMTEDLYYDRKILGTVITFKQMDLKAGVSVELQISSAYKTKALLGFVGALGNIRRARYAKDAMDALNVNYGSSRANVTAVALAATHMDPNFAEALPQLWTDAQKQASALLKSNKDLKNDPRRSQFISKILLLPEAVAASAAPQYV